jgi:hypothetical protein
MSFNSISDKRASSLRDRVRRRHSKSVSMIRRRNEPTRRGSRKTFSRSKIDCDDTDCVVTMISRNSSMFTGDSVPRFFRRSRPAINCRRRVGTGPITRPLPIICVEDLTRRFARHLTRLSGISKSRAIDRKRQQIITAIACVKSAMNLNRLRAVVETSR